MILGAEADLGGIFAEAVETQHPQKRPQQPHPSERRKSPRKYEHVAPQALNPFGKSSIMHCSLAQLWNVCSKGNKYVP